MSNQHPAADYSAIDPDVSYTTDEAGKLLSTSDRQVRKLIAEERLNAFRLGRHWRVSRRAIREFQERHSAKEVV